jgi:hypothetical protein
MNIAIRLTFELDRYNQGWVLRNLPLERKGGVRNRDVFVAQEFIKKSKGKKESSAIQKSIVTRML